MAARPPSPESALKSRAQSADIGVMRARTLGLVAFALAMAAGPVASADAAPTISSVKPLATKVSEELTVNGSGFLPGEGRNTVAFMSDYGPVVLVKSKDSTRSRLVVGLPAKLESGMRRSGGQLQPNRFRVRVAAGDQTSSFTPSAKSPEIAPRFQPPPPPPDNDKDGIPDARDPDDDNDKLTDAIERSVRTDPKRRDTDGDGMEDGWEYYSARDLNENAVPYPVKRPYPNALLPETRDVDYDGDFLTSKEEHAAWRFTGRSFQASASADPTDSRLGYSDGTQTSRPAAPSQTPVFKRAIPVGSGIVYPGFLEESNSYHAPNGIYSDDERDADNDGLNNVIEEHAQMRRKTWEHWLSRCKEPTINAWANLDAEGGPAYWGAFSHTQAPDYLETKRLDPDSDGDSLLDGEDDQDWDGARNYQELAFACAVGLTEADRKLDADDKVDAGETPHVHPYNPCAPDPASRSCPRYRPIGG
jgi:hypothetical protein